MIAPATHKYEVRAFDAAGNVSAFSNSDTAAVTAPDAEPAASGQPGRRADGHDHVDLSWEASTDDVAVTGYGVYRDGACSRQLARRRLLRRELAPGPHSYEVRALDAGRQRLRPQQRGRLHGHPTRRRGAPTAPGNLAATNGGPAPGQVTLTWLASSDNVAVTGYRIYRGGAQIASPGPATSHTDANLAPGAYSYTVRAGETSPATSPVLEQHRDGVRRSGPTPAARPPMPGFARAPGLPNSQVDLSWQASSPDNVAVTGLRDPSRRGG